MPAIRMIDTWVKSGKACAIDGKRTNWTDTKATGLVLRVSPPSRKFKEGLKTWALSYRRKSDGKKRFFTIGRYSEHGFTLAEARITARELMVAIERGADPAGEKQGQKQTDTLEELALLWVEDYAKDHKKSWEADLALLKRDVVPTLGSLKANRVTRRNIRDLFEKKTKGNKEQKIKPAPVAANRMLDRIKSIYNWGIANDHVEGMEVNPATLITKNAEKSRTQFLEKDADVELYWSLITKSNMSDPAKDILKLALLTGQRSGEPRQVKRAHINLEEKTWTIKAEISKTQGDHILPLAPEALEIFKAAMERSGDSEYVFPSPVTDEPLHKRTVGRAWERMRKGTSLEGINIHDMRRTLRTGLAKMGVHPDTGDRITNHGQKKNQSTGERVYTAFRYGDEMRAALEAWENHVMGIVEGREVDKNNVVVLRG